MVVLVGPVGTRGCRSRAAPRRVRYDRAMTPDPSRRPLPALLLVLTVLTALPSCRADRGGARRVEPTATRPATIPAPGYVKPDQFDFRRIMGDPPADDSPEHRAEVAR